ncbi:MAG: peptidylprolyl isomerase [Phycisphaerales bacterium]
MTHANLAPAAGLLALALGAGASLCGCGGSGSSSAGGPARSTVAPSDFARSADPAPAPAPSGAAAMPGQPATTMVIADPPAAPSSSPSTLTTTTGERVTVGEPATPPPPAAPPSGAVRPVRIDAAAEAPAVAPPALPVATPPGPAPSPRSAPTPAALPPANTQGVVVLTGEPATGTISAAARPIGGPALVDSLVGQINGKPIYASRFLSELDKRLSAEAERLKYARDPWRRSAAEIIGGELRRQVQDDLLLAEARAALSPEERQGLIFFVNRLRENITSSYQGSEILADEELRKEGLSLEGKVTREQQDILVRTLFQRYVGPRVNPSFRDVQRAYDRNFIKYNPVPVAKLRMIWVPADGKHDAEVAQVNDLLAQGKPFAEVASMPLNQFGSKDGGLTPEKQLSKPYAEMRLFEDAALNDAAHKLSPGTYTGPFDYPRVKAWMYLESITQAPGRPLEDVQLEIMSELRSEKFNSEANRFFMRLRERASVTNEVEMITTLVTIAEERYLIAGRPLGR